MEPVYDNLIGKAWISSDLFDKLKAEGKLSSELGKLYVYQGYELLLDMSLPPNTLKVLKPEIVEQVWDSRMKNFEGNLAHLNKLMGDLK
ncbi:hypothetical protein VP501E541_P0244 [Vibrio phage 501E54-1]|nr:hypothetical protein VP501E541_P0244 [Vibrio phage 501E54-1]